MSVRAVPCRVLIPGAPAMKFVTRDKMEFFDLDEAVEHENKIALEDPIPVVYEQVWTIQEAINKAVAENRVVRFLWNGDNESIKKGIVDSKGCQFMKPEKDSKDVAVIPPTIHNFVFDEVK